MPHGVFPIGDNVFIVVTSYYDSISVHIRRFDKHGETYYPTTEGITLAPSWIQSLLKEKKVPESQEDLPYRPFPPERHLQISSEDFVNFTFKRIRYGPDKQASFKEIVISREQWGEMIKLDEAIQNAVVDKTFQCMDFLTAYKSCCETPIAKTLPPSSLDVSLGKAYLTKILQEAVHSLFNEKGMKPAKTYAEELWGNRVETFNAFALSIEADEIADLFCSNLYKDVNFLDLQPVHYVTEKFFENLRFDNILKDLRELLCPPDCFEYYEDFPPNFVYM